MEPLLPSSPLVVRVLAEHPWGAVFPLLVVGAGLAWFGSRADRARLVLAGVGVLLVAAGILAGAALWRSPGEQAADAVRALVSAAERADIPAVEAAFAADASMHYGTPQAPGYDMREILRAAQALRGRHRIESNAVTELAFATVDDDTAQVVLGCRTTTQSSFGPVPNRWWMELRRQPDGRWLVERLAFLQVGSQRPGRGTL
jgi:hypothetical protein